MEKFIVLKCLQVSLIDHYVKKLVKSFQKTCHLSARLSSRGMSLAGLQIRVRIGKLFSLFRTQNICCGYSTEPYQRDGFLSTKTHVELMGKEIIKILRSKMSLLSGSMDHHYAREFNQGRNNAFFSYQSIPYLTREAIGPRGPVISLGRYVPQLGGGGGGWYSGIFIHTWTRSILGVHNFEFQYFLGFQKNKYFWGYEDFVDIFGVITILDYI